MIRVLVAPLDWGLGHAARCIPIIRMLLKKDCDVLIAGAGPSLKFLREEFPKLAFIEITGYEPVYPRKGSMVFRMARQLPGFLRVIRKEHAEIQRIVTEHRIDCIVSDNRFGCWSPLVPTAFITHQSNILMPQRFGWLSGWVRRTNLRMIEKFSMCWVPDDHVSRLSGVLSGFGTTPRIPVHHLGVLSRFRRARPAEKKYDVVAVVSGPEPQREIFEQILLAALKSSSLRWFLVRGVPGHRHQTDRLADFMNTEALQSLFESSEIVIARSGYSTVMDLAVVGCNAVLVPTPGQTEQEYLAARLKQQKIFYTCEQSTFDLARVMEESRNYHGFLPVDPDDTALDQAIDDLLARLVPQTVGNFQGAR